MKNFKNLQTSYRGSILKFQSIRKPTFPVLRGAMLHKNGELFQYHPGNVIKLHARPRMWCQIAYPIAKRVSDVMTRTRLKTNKLEWWMIFKISLRAKAGERKLRLHSLYFPQNSLTLTESSGEFSNLHSIYRLRTSLLIHYGPCH